MNEQNCGTCLYASFEKTNHKPPRYVKDAVSKCNWKANFIWPDSVPEDRRRVVMNYVTPEMGATCPCWISREKTY